MKNYLKIIILFVTLGLLFYFLGSIFIDDVYILLCSVLMHLLFFIWPVLLIIYSKQNTIKIVSIIILALYIIFMMYSITLLFGLGVTATKGNIIIAFLRVYFLVPMAVGYYIF
ncbi:hypothetical protein KKA15_06940 [Patescibacteria group bacterium]|nr:hypothetical protein [Patescibacteria group bacterium]